MTRGGDKSGLLARLYPIPLSTGVVRLPGPTAASSQALLNVLLHNRENYHIYFNDIGYHKYVGFLNSTIKYPSHFLNQSHATHHVLAIYGLGASSEIIEEAYSRHDFLKPAFDSPEPITDKNFAEHLGDGR
jgi:hypothetical protein